MALDSTPLRQLPMPGGKRGIIPFWTAQGTFQTGSRILVGFWVDQSSLDWAWALQVLFVGQTYTSSQSLLKLLSSTRHFRYLSTFTWKIVNGYLS